MAILFNERELVVTDERIRTPGRDYPISRVSRVWCALPESTRGVRLMVIATLVGVVLAVGIYLTTVGWLRGHLIALPFVLTLVCVLVGLLGWAGILDPVAVYLEKRRHELWIETDGMAVLLWSNNKVEVNKALRAIGRARERHDDARWS
jgi:hypothetical protein